MFKLSIPQTTRKGDAVFFRTGIRFSNDFIEREDLSEFRYVWIFLDLPYVGFTFSRYNHPNTIKIIDSSKNTSGKTVSCAYLKQHKLVADVMEAKNVNDRKFSVRKSNETTDTAGLKVEYQIDITENMDLPF